MKYLMVTLLLLGFVGCGGVQDAPETRVVKGTVLFDGKPIPLGNIDFVPADGIGPSASGTITDGEFEFNSPIGDKKVMIFASKKTGRKGEEFGEDIMESYIPESYNTKTKLIETVKPDSENVFVLEVKDP